MTPKLWERKWEIDSLAAVLKLSTEYIAVTKDYSIINEYYADSIIILIDTLKV